MPLETPGRADPGLCSVEGIGDDDAWDGIDLTGKVAVCARGTINFSERPRKRLKPERRPFSFITTKPAPSTWI